MNRLALLLLISAQLDAMASPREDTITPDDKATLLRVTKAFIENCPSCKTPGFDYVKGDIVVSKGDLALRDKWISDLETTNKDRQEYRVWKGFMDTCKLKSYPQIKVDVAPVKLWQVNVLADPLPEAIYTVAYQCTGRPNADVVAVIQGIKTIHFTLAHPFPTEGAGYVYSYDKKTGELTIGLHNHAQNINAAAQDWFEKQR